jgi:hypothetical protein
MLTQVVEARPALKQIEYSAETAKDEIVKAVAEENGGSIQGISIPREVAAEISSVSRCRSSEANISGVYKVAKVDTTAPDGFRVTLEDVGSGEMITASLFDALISAQHRQILQDAEWNKKPVRVEMSGRRLHGRMNDTKVVDVSAIAERSA